MVLDAETGEVKALVGGRSYGTSQLNHAMAKRQPGSSFKPFVYAAAIDDALKEGGKVHHARHHRGRRTDHVLVRRQAVRAGRFRRQICRRGDAAPGAGAFDEHSGGESRRDGGLRQGREDGARGRAECGHQADAVHRAGRLRSDAARNRGRLHGVRQRGPADEAELHQEHSRSAGTAVHLPIQRSRRSRPSIRAWPT